MDNVWTMCGVHWTMCGVRTTRHGCHGGLTRMHGHCQSRLHHEPRQRQLHPNKHAHVRIDRLVRPQSDGTQVARNVITHWALTAAELRNRPQQPQDPGPLHQDGVVRLLGMAACGRIPFRHVGQWRGRFQRVDFWEKDTFGGAGSTAGSMHKTGRTTPHAHTLSTPGLECVAVRVELCIAVHAWGLEHGCGSDGGLVVLTCELVGCMFCCEPGFQSVGAMFQGSAVVLGSSWGTGRAFLARAGAIACLMSLSVPGDPHHTASRR